MAELDGRVVGSNLFDEWAPIAGLSSFTVNPAVQNRAIGRHLMQDGLVWAGGQNGLGVRLVHASYVQALIAAAPDFERGSFLSLCVTRSRLTGISHRGAAWPSCRR